MKGKLRKDVVAGVPITRDVDEAFRRVAERRCTTRAAVMREVLEEWLERQPQEQPVST